MSRLAAIVGFSRDDALNGWSATRKIPVVGQKLDFLQNVCGLQCRRLLV